MKNTIFAFLALMIFSTGCLERKTVKNNAVPDDVAVTAPDNELLPFVGTWSKCHVVTGKGTEFGVGTSSYVIELEIYADGTYTHNRWYYGDSPTCSGSQNTISWGESGNVAIIVDSASVSGAKEMSFERTTSNITARDYAGPPSNLFATRFNTSFNPAAGGGTTHMDPTGIFLNNAGGAFMMGDFIINAGTTYNTISVSGITMSMKEPLDWSVGQISAPVTQDYNLTQI